MYNSGQTDDDDDNVSLWWSTRRSDVVSDDDDVGDDGVVVMVLCQRFAQGVIKFEILYNIHVEIKQAKNRSKGRKEK